VVDIVPPAIDLRTPSGGATYDLGAQVTVDFSCSDPKGTGVQVCAGDLPVGAPLDTSLIGTHTFHVFAVDNSRNISQKTSTYTVVDRRPPTIQITSPGNGATYTLGQAVSAAYWCASSPSAHLVSCLGPVANGGSVDTSTIGTKTFTVNAVDDQGKTATATLSYSVVFTFSGFDSPVGAGGSIGSAKAGDSVPLKFSLRGNQGLGAVTQTTWQQSSCTDWSALGTSTPAQAKLSYSASTDRYVDLVGTDPSWKGSCRTVDVGLTDGTHHSVRVQFTK
jgi:hypothetical protein